MVVGVVSVASLGTFVAFSWVIRFGVRWTLKVGLVLGQVNGGITIKTVGGCPTASAIAAFRTPVIFLTVPEDRLIDVLRDIVVR